MYSEQYPKLQQAFPFDNFEVIVEAIEKHFPSLFNLDIIENELKNGQRNGSYIQFFSELVNQLRATEHNDLYTVSQIANQIYTILHNDFALRNRFLSQLIFVPPQDQTPSNQMGFQEKVATGSLQVGEAVTYLDMLRITYFLQRLHERHTGSSRSSTQDTDIAVLNLASVQKNDMQKFMQNSRAIVINLNLDLKGTPKWGVINLQDHKNPRVYCETPLLQSERRALEERIGLFTDVSPGKADSLESTGYSAIAWLDQNITHGWNFDTDADFNVIFGDYALTIFRADAGGVHFRSVNNEYQQYFTPELRATIDARYGRQGRDPAAGSQLWGNFSLFRMAGFATLDQIEGEAIPYNNLARVIEVVGRRRLTDNQFEHYSNLGFRSKVPRFAHTLGKYGSPTLLTGDEDQARLTVPEMIDCDRLEDVHRAACSDTHTDPLLFRFLKRNPAASRPHEADLATAMVLTLFRARAKKPLLNIHLPAKFQLDAQEKQQIVSMMQDNAFVTELVVNDNHSLKELKKELLPVLARNRWLKENGYLPPMFDFYWKRAAKYWLYHLNEHADLLKPKQQHEFFKRCVEEMGLKGLQAVLDYLGDPQLLQHLIGVYGKNRPAFYLACQPDEMNDYLELLLNHLRHGHAFPFSELGAAFQPQYNQKYLELITYVNSQTDFNRIQLTDCLRHQDEFGGFLKQLAIQANQEGWTGLIVIPELEEKENTGEEYRELRLLYRQLNNVILTNRHKKQGIALSQQIKDSSEFEDFATKSSKNKNHKKPAVHDIHLRLPESDIGPWPLTRGGAVQLQLQQQQEIQQNRQIQQKQQKMLNMLLERPISSELVTYDNIDRVLGDYYRKFKEENHCDPKKFASLWQSDTETELQGFFHTWINAMPKVAGREVIASMTQEAAKMMLHHHTRVSSGFNLSNPAKGFYAQRSKDGQLILGYSPEIGYVSGVSTPLTPILYVSTPEAELWEGDFRQFNVEAYLKASAPALKSAVDFQSLILFEAMQPPKAYHEAWEEFKKENPKAAKLIGKKHEKRVVDHWLVFLQAWQYQGVDGVQQFLNLKETDFLLHLPSACKILFRGQSEQLIEWTLNWARRGKTDDATLRAIGQVYYRYGEQAVGLLLSKFRQIENRLGTEFFDKFTGIVLNRSNNFCCFFNVAFFQSMDTMINHLSKDKTGANSEIWLSFCDKHLSHVPWEDPTTLWEAFDEFIQRLNDMGLTLSGHEFNRLPPQNMIVALDRILASLQSLPNQNEKTRFLTSLYKLDLTHGGVHYAIQQENFKYFDDELYLHQFKKGDPTYGPDLAKLYTWPEASLKIQRILASCPQFTYEDYGFLCRQLANENLSSRDQLIWLLYTQFDSRQIQDILGQLQGLPREMVSAVAQYLHKAAFKYGHQLLEISLTALTEFAAELTQPRFQYLMAQYPEGNLLESLSILANSKQQAHFDDMLALFESKPLKKEDYPDFLYREAFKLATLFGAFSAEHFKQFIDATSGLKLAVQHELSLLIKHLLSVDYQANNAALQNPQNWQQLLECIQKMNQKPGERTQLRNQFISSLADQGIAFKYSKSGKFRHITDNECPSLSLFIDHEYRLKEFLKKRIVVLREGEAVSEQLKPILAFFTRLQLNRTYLNEIEPLLAILEKTTAGVWSASYFSQMLDVLKPEKDQDAFPLDMLQVILSNEILGAQSIDSVEEAFPSELVVPLKAILRNTIFTRPQQALLCQLAIKEYQFSRTTLLLNDALNLLSPENRAESRGYALQILLASRNTSELNKRFQQLSQLLNHHTGSMTVSGTWSKTTALWLKAMTADPHEEDLFKQVMSSVADAQEEKRAMLLHIIAWSSLRPGLRNKETYEFELRQRAPKLIARLASLSSEQLAALSACYPRQPSPGADDLIRLLKKPDLYEALEQFLKHPHPETRADFQQVAKTRQPDLQRMFVETRVTDGKLTRPLSGTEIGRLSLMFAELKQLESGEICVEGTNKPIHEMSQPELAQSFQCLAKRLREGKNDSLQVQMWAVLFEALGRTTRKYPHLAQQFALLANDIAVDSKSRVLKLATGEGKSHFVAMRAAYHAAQGKAVDVFTAKRSLAERDLKDYSDFFSYLHLSASNITPKSSRENYVNSQIHYLTLGDLSLFLDEQSYQGKPIPLDKNKRVGLGDEIDFTLFDEGRKTEYNYARPTGRTPKQMIWFYQAVNEFYRLQHQHLLIDKISNQDLRLFLDFMVEKANGDEDKEAFLGELARDGLQLVRWLQSAHEAHTLERGIGFTVREENIQVGDASYLMKEIIPLSTDNQKMPGSTFSAGVHQLLAVRLNTEAKARNEAQNYHVHAESNIISSQIAGRHLHQLWGEWEGFSGTVSNSQAQDLYHSHGTTVLHVCTNQHDLRNWHEPKFYTSDEKRMQGMVYQLRKCMTAKQSILFSCKSDQQVLLLKQKLSRVLSEAEMANIIFYTNEDNESSRAVLQRKQKKENWQDGKKQQGIALVASGFGRGDNVGVEAVFLYDAGDINDLKQKGGRTARNGEEGEVFQFYVESEVQAEEKVLQSLIAKTPGVPEDALERALRETEGRNTNEKAYYRVMFLREYLFTLQNIANQGYRAGIAQFSNWAMRLVSTFTEPAQASELTHHLTQSMIELDKHWLSITSRELSPGDKIRMIEEKIRERALSLHVIYLQMKKDHSIADFKLEAYPAVNLLIEPEVKQEGTFEAACMAQLGAILAVLPIAEKDRELSAEIPAQLNALARHREELVDFTRQAAQFQSVREFMDQLAIRLIQIAQPSKSFKQTSKEITEKPAVHSLFDDLPADIRATYLASMNCLMPALQDGIEEWLYSTSLVRARDKVEAILPLIAYLARFTRTEQSNWGQDYIAGIDSLLHSARETLPARLSGVAMSYDTNAILWRLATQCPGQETSILANLQKSLKNASTQRIRALVLCERLLISLSEKEKTSFLNNFAILMTTFGDQQHWNSFQNLLKKTERWWNVADGKYRQDIQLLWQQMAAYPALSQIQPLIDGCLTAQDNDWIQSLLSLTQMPASFLSLLKLEQWNNLQALWSQYHFSAEERGQCLQYLSALFKDWRKLPDFSAQVDAFLENYGQYLRQYQEEDPGQLIVANRWYLSLIQQVPEARAALDGIVRQENRLLSLQTLRHELNLNSFDGKWTSNLFNTALQLNPASDSFSLWCSGLNTFVQLLKSTAQLSQQEKAGFNQRLAALPADKLTLLLAVFEKHPHQLEANPRVIHSLLEYAETAAITANRLLNLTCLLLQTAGTRIKTPADLNHLMMGVDRFRNASYSDDAALYAMSLMEGDNALSAREVLFNDLADYLAKHVQDGQRQPVNAMIKWFYDHAKTSHGNPELMKQALKESSQFHFNNGSKTAQNHRVILMHLLNHQAFVTGQQKLPALDNHSFQWTAKDNLGLLKQGFDCYIAETKRLLAAKPRAGLSLQRDLNVTQQRGLLGLAEELSVIGQAHLDLSRLHQQKDSRDNLQSLQNNLHKLVSNYHGAWFKSKGRKDQIQNLTEQLRNQFEGAAHGPQSRYEAVLEIIRQTRIDAMEADFRENAQRRQKLNRSGHSRLFSTLNQMEDEIVRHWVQDMSAIQRFQNYQERCQRDVIDLSRQLWDALNLHYQSAYLPPEDERNKQLMYRIGNWFSAREKQACADLRAHLYTFVNQHDAEGLEAGRLQNTIALLKQHRPLLPGHLKTLVDEVLMRSDSLLGHLYAKAEQPLEARTVLE